MAGIGFELYKILQKGTLGSYLKAFLLGTIIVAGPWILSVLSIYFIQKYAHNAISESPTLFTVSIVYIYAFSLFFFGGVHYIFSRYIADMMYIKDDEAIPPALILITGGVIILSVIMSGVFLELNHFTLKHHLLYKISFISLFITVNIIWVMLIYIALLKEYYKIFFAYLAGVLVSIYGVFFLGKSYGVAGALAGYTAGQVVIVLILFLISLKSYPIHLKGFSFNVFTYFGKFKYLFFTGLFFNMAIWVDKIIYWFVRGTHIKGTYFYFFVDYDIPVFLAFLSMIPGLVYFLIVSEPIFHRAYTVFMKNVLKDTMTVIKKNKADVIQNLRKGLLKQILFQSVWTIGLLMNTEKFISFMGFGKIDPRIMQILLIAVFFHMLTLALQIYLMYLELRRQVLLSSIVYFMLNASITVLFVLNGVGNYGLSYLAASVCTACYCGFHIYRKVPLMDYIIFSKT